MKTRISTRRAVKTQAQIYLDFAASTPVEPSVLEAMRPYFSEKFGNPGSLHTFGQEAIAALDRSRETIAVSCGAQFREIIFTGSATEANNLVLRGAVKSLPSSMSHPKIIVSSIEHESVLEAAKDLERAGAVELIILRANKSGIVDVAQLEGEINERTVVVSVMYANNETGAIQPIAKIGAMIREYHATHKSRYPLFHTDAVQAFQFLDCNVEALGVDLMTISAHKIYGPKGVGALYIRGAEQGKMLQAIISGGGQEYGLRSGTQNVPAIAGFAKAVELIGKDRAKHSTRIQSLRDTLWREIKKIHPEAQLNCLPANILPNMLNIHFPKRNADELLVAFDLAGIAVSAGSACTARSLQPSYVLQNMGCSTARAKSSLRFSLGRPTTAADISRVASILKKVLRSK